MEDRFFSVVLPTHNRRNLLRLVLDALCKQSYSRFSVVLVIKPSNDGTEDLAEQYRNKLRMKVIFQERGYVTEALNLGLENAKGDVIGFLDDDAIPAPDWLRIHAETYRQFDVAGVAGDVIPAKICRGKLEALCEKGEPPFLYPLSKIKYSLWNKPLRGADGSGTSGYFVYITRSGNLGSIGNMAYWRGRGLIRSFLGMGANITVLRKAIEGFVFDNSWVLGAGWEQLLAWYIWKSGFDLVYNPKAKVFHVTHGQTLSRALSSKKATLFQAEKELLFYRLYGKEKSLSTLCHLISLFYRSMEALKKKELYRLRGVVKGNIIGFKWLILSRFGLKYDPITDLEALWQPTKRAA